MMWGNDNALLCAVNKLSQYIFVIYKLWLAVYVARIDIIKLQISFISSSV